jgi:CheY-like chemotaxis protein
MAYILIIEDADDIREALCEWLFEVGFDAIGVSNAAEAKDFLSRHRCQCLVLLDLRLPDERGEAVLRWIRSHPRHRDNPVIVVTASGAKRVSGSNALLAKPLDFDMLFELINRHIGALSN